MKFLLAIWRLLGDVLGERDYARYCAHMRSRHPDTPLPNAREYYLTRLKEKYSRPSRCC